MRAPVALLVSLVLALSACGSDASTASGEPEIGSEEFGLSMPELTDRIGQVEAAIATCMTEAGFEYVPLTFEAVRTAMTSDKTASGLSEEEFAVEYGYGVSTQLDKPIVRLSLGDGNQQIVDSLSDADRTAYRRALYGEHTDATFAYALELEDFSRTGGCTRDAVEQFFTEDEMSSSYFNPGDFAIEQDRRYQDALDEFALCMADGGFDRITDPNQPEDDLREQFDQIVGDQDPTALSEQDAAAMTELQALELALAPVASECESEIVDPAAEEIEREIYGFNPG